ncbi:MAG TPA: SDR family NAD(P)-dependent oxidoreductase [Holophagaceae bacterium]|nr:SDR family NAD(P)-dependent oxidoreductase [Holophagaceae bacterium]
MANPKAPLTVLVGMGPGMGMALARRFGREGHRLGLLARRAEALGTLVADLQAEGFDVHGHAVDASDFGGLKLVLGKAEPDVLIYNASVFREAMPSQLAPEDLVSEFRAMAGGFLASVQAVLPSMKAKDRGTILLTGGGSALSPFASGASLSVGKAAQRSLLLSLAQELGETGIHAATVTICGMIQPGTAFDPEKLAEQFWQLHAQPRGGYEVERVIKG